MCCGRPDTPRRSSREPARASIDPTRALFAASRPMYEVLAHAGVQSGKGKRFTNLANAENYARRTGGIVRPT